MSSIKHHKFHAHPISSHPIYFECFVNAKSNRLFSQINIYPNSTYTPRACGRDVQHGNGPKFLQLRFYSSNNFIHCLQSLHSEQRQDQGPVLKGLLSLDQITKKKHNIKRPQILGSIYSPPTPKKNICRFEVV